MDTTHKIVIDSTHKAIQEVKGLEYKKIQVTLTDWTSFINSPLKFSKGNEVLMLVINFIRI